MAIDPISLAASCRLSFTAFSRVALPAYQHPPHLALIDQALAQVALWIETKGKAGIGRLAIELPPRHGKSVKCARLFAAWAMGRNPDLRVILASHTAALSEGHSRWVRNCIKSPLYADCFPQTRIADDSAAREAWDLASPAQGGMLAVGVDGAVHGRGGGLIVADDLVRSLEAYQSETARDKLWDWFSTDLLSRQEPAAAVIMIGTRFGLDDPLGRLELHEPKRWTRIRLPALAGDQDPLGRAPGQALWPERFDRDWLLAQRQSMGSYSFEALYQQNPQAASGGILRREKLQVIDVEPSNIKTRVRYWDLAMSSKTSADYTVGCLLGETPDKRLIVLDVVRVQVAWADVCDKIAEVAQSDGTGVRIGLESAFYQGQAVTDLLKRPDMHGFSVRGIKPTSDKVTRSLPFAARVDNQQVFVLRRAWTQDFIDESAAFPGAANDDQVDAVSGAYSMLGAASASEIVQSPNPFFEEDGNPFEGTALAPRLRSQPAAIDLNIPQLDRLNVKDLHFPEAPGAPFTWLLLDYSPASNPGQECSIQIQAHKTATGYRLQCPGCRQLVEELQIGAGYQLECTTCKERQAVR